MRFNDSIFHGIFSSYTFCLFQPEYSYVDGDETVPAESAKVPFPLPILLFFDHVYLVYKK